jgi:hypothetical protein
MKDSLTRRVRRLTQALGPCQACDERDRRAAEQEQRMRTRLEEWRARPSAPEPKTPDELRAEAAKLRSKAAALRGKADRREATDWQRDIEDHAKKEAADSRMPFADGCLRCRAQSEEQPSPAVRHVAARLGDVQRQKEYEPSSIRIEADTLDQKAHDLELDATGTCNCGCPTNSGWGYRLYRQG